METVKSWKCHLLSWKTAWVHLIMKDISFSSCEWEGISGVATVGDDILLPFLIHSFQVYIMAFTKKSKIFRSRSCCKSDFKPFFLSPSFRDHFLLSWCAGVFVLSNQVAKCLRCRDLAALQSNAAVGTALHGGRELLRLIFTWRYSSVLTHNGYSESRNISYRVQKTDFPLIE